MGLKSEDRSHRADESFTLALVTQIGPTVETFIQCQLVKIRSVKRPRRVSAFAAMSVSLPTDAEDDGKA